MGSAGRRRHEARELRSQPAASSTGARTAFGEPVHTASSTAAPAASILPSRSASSRLPPAACPGVELCGGRAALGVRCPVARSSPIDGPDAHQPEILRRGAVHRRRRRSRACASAVRWIPAQSRSTRCTGPHVHSSSAPAYPRAGLLFQLRITPLAGSIAWACADAGREPLPLVLAGALRRQPRVDGRRPERQPAARELRDVLLGPRTPS